MGVAHVRKEVGGALLARIVACLDAVQGYLAHKKTGLLPRNTIGP